MLAEDVTTDKASDTIRIWIVRLLDKHKLIMPST